MLKIAGGIILAIILLAAGCAVLVGSSLDDETIEFATTQSGENVQTENVQTEEAAEEEEVPGETAGQRNARRSAVSYLR